MKIKVTPFAIKASEMIREDHQAIANAITKQIHATVPAYADVASEAMARNIDLILGGAARYLETRQEERLMGALTMVMDLRRAGGFSVNDFVVAILCAFPVLRRYFLRNTSHLAEGLATYEAYEALTLPLVGRVASSFSQMADENNTMPDSIPIEAIFGKLAGIDENYEVVSVVKASPMR